MEKEPRKCGNSACVGGVYFCRIACIPCVRCKKCALDMVKDMAEETKGAMMKGKSHVKETDRA